MLLEELTQDPENLGYASLIALGNHSGITELLNLVDNTRTSIQPGTFATVCTLIARLGPTGAVIAKN